MDLTHLSNSEWEKVNVALTKSRKGVIKAVKLWEEQNPLQKKAFVGSRSASCNTIAVVSTEGTIPTQLQSLLKKKFDGQGLKFKHMTLNRGDKAFCLEPKNWGKFVDEVLEK